MTKILVIEHAPQTLGVLQEVFQEGALAHQVFNFKNPPGESPSEEGEALVVLGGPMSVYETELHPFLKQEMDLIRRFAEQEKPVMGLCLGAQLAAEALGGKVHPSPVKEFGWHPVQVTKEAALDPLFRHFQNSEMVFQWHQDTFRLPEAGQLLVTSGACPVQGFRWGKSVYGFQFHLEIDKDMIVDWTQELEPSDEKEVGKTLNPRQIREETPANLARSQSLFKQVFHSFLRLI